MGNFRSNVIKTLSGICFFTLLLCCPIGANVLDDIGLFSDKSLPIQYGASFERVFGKYIWSIHTAKLAVGVEQSIGQASLPVKPSLVYAYPFSWGSLQFEWDGISGKLGYWNHISYKVAYWTKMRVHPQDPGVTFGLTILSSAPSPDMLETFLEAGAGSALTEYFAYLPSEIFYSLNHDPRLRSIFFRGPMMGTY